MLRTFALLCLLTATAAEGMAADPSWEAVVVGPGKLAVPKAWRKLDGIQPRMVIFRQGDGVFLPHVDETKAPLQVGLTVEKFAGSKESATELTERLIAGIKKDRRLELVGKEVVEEVKLSDGTSAELLTAEFVKEGSRRSLQMKLVTKAGETAWTASGYLVGGKDSNWPTPGSKYGKWLRGHLVSFSLDPAKFDEKAVNELYAEFAK